MNDKMDQVANVVLETFDVDSLDDQLVYLPKCCVMAISYPHSFVLTRNLLISWIDPQLDEVHIVVNRIRSFVNCFWCILSLINATRML